MTQAQVSYTDSCPLVLRYPVSGSLESVRLSSDVRERLIVECCTNKANVNGIHVSGQDFPSLAGGRAVVIIHYAIIPFV